MTLDIIEDCVIDLEVDSNTGQETVTYTAGAMIDDDGSGSAHGDPDEEPDTSLHHADGTALNADLESYIVVPPAIIAGTKGIVLGCAATVTYNGIAVESVAGDIGPHRKLGEMSICCANSLGIPSSPTTGGISDKTVTYVLTPGIAASGYCLQASSAS
jgi:hypothetical protein